MTKEQENIQKVIDYIKELPEEKYRQGTYRKVGDCGCIVFHGERALGVKGKYYAEFLGEEFGIEGYLQKNELWGSCPFGDYFDQDYHVWITHPGPRIEDAIAVLENLKNTGTVDWSVAPNWPTEKV